jgi:hypothetical protein
MKASRIVSAGMAALAGLGVVAMVPPAAQAGAAPAATWTKQAPATRPTRLSGAAMAYDAATGTEIMFGGGGVLHDLDHQFRGTWTWNGTNWTKQNPATSPTGRDQAAMAYDAATRTVVLFGGWNGHGELGDTWTWNGTTWTEQHPAASPPAMVDTSMVYDQATGTVLLFAGEGNHVSFHGLWAWNGTTWTEQAGSATLPARHGESMAYDAATHTVVVFGGVGGIQDPLLNDTWTWNGTTWTEQHPAANPPARWEASAAYDAATGTVVLFGGYYFRGVYGDTWTWDGTTWAQQAPAAHPAPRENAAMAYDPATRSVVLFGGDNPRRVHGLQRSTWTWR